MHDDERPSTIPPPPPDQPVRPMGWGLKRAQEFLKRHGFVLAAYGPTVSFYPADVKRTPEGLVPDEAWTHLDTAGFREFARGLEGDDDFG